MELLHLLPTVRATSRLLLGLEQAYLCNSSTMQVAMQAFHFAPIYNAQLGVAVVLADVCSSKK